MPFKSSLMRSAGKLFGVSNQEDLDLRGETAETRWRAVAKASGGTKSSPGDGYIYHQFYASVPGTAPGPYTKTPNTSDTFETLEALTCDVLIIGGGAGGGSTPSGNTGGGGGGAGAVIYLTSQPFPIATYPLTVGGGGQDVDPVAAPAAANRGDESIFNGSTAYGGGPGGYGAGNGGSGGPGNSPGGWGSGGGGGAGYPSPGPAGTSGNPAHPGSGTDVPSVPASVYGFGRAGGIGGGDGSNLSAGGGGGGISSVGLQGESGSNPPGYSQGGAGGAGGLYTISGTAQGVGGGGAGGSYSKTGVSPTAYDSGGGIMDSRAWPTGMAIYSYPGPIGIPQRFHGLDGTGGGGTGGCSSPGYVSGAPPTITVSGRGGCGLVQIRYPE